jgi:hypothetical protein
MIFHVVLFAPRPDLTPGDEDAFASALERAVRDIPTVRGARVGRRVIHGQAYESLASADFPYAAIVEFDDLDGLQAYLAHPAHEALGARFYETLRAALVFDYDMGPVAAIRGWLDTSRGVAGKSSRVADL